MKLPDFLKRIGIPSRSVPLYFFNTLGREKQRFEPMPRAKEIRMYNCGPTVYDTSHIGNLRSYVFADLVRRVLEYNGFKVKQVINITDFGHLSSDADAGQDKMSTALSKAGLALTMENMHDLAEKFATQFIRDLGLLNIETSRIEFPRASAYIKGEIALIQTLEEKGYTYRGASGVYFDTSRFPQYGKLGNINLTGLKEGARVAAAEDKRAATDFLLWKPDENLGWESPWGRGFPGWHIECSAMINATLGKQIDIHTGGIDLMPTHHNNEIAQSESATGKRPFSRFWLHHEFLNLADAKISKSAGNMINLAELTAKGYHPLAYRYFLLGAHYRTPINFTWEALAAASTARTRLSAHLDAPDGGEVSKKYQRRFRERINDDLDTAGALAVLWEMVNDDSISAEVRRATLLDADTVLGLGLASIPRGSSKTIPKNGLPLNLQTLFDERESARKEKNYKRADEIRDTFAQEGYLLSDNDGGTVVEKK